MSEDSITTVQVIGEGAVLTLVELCRISQADEEQVRVWVDEGVLKPLGDPSGEWRFPAAALQRARIARSLSRDLELNPPGVALALDLMEEIESLRARLRCAGLGG